MKEEGIDLFKKGDRKKLFKGGKERSETNWYPSLCIVGSGWFVYSLFFSSCPSSLLSYFLGFFVFIITFFTVKHKIKYEIKRRKRNEKKDL